MSFGIGVGDIIAVTKLINDVINCLRESKGSAAEYREAVVELRSFQAALDAIEQIQVAPDRQMVLDSIKIAALNSRYVLEDYLEKLASYGLLSEKSGEHKARRLVKKIQWAAQMQKATLQLQGYLAAHTSSLNMRLVAEGLQSAFDNAERTAETQRRLEAKVDDATVVVRNVQSEVQGIAQILQRVSIAELLDRLSSLDFRQRQLDIHNRRQAHTGEWLLSEPTFVKWMQGIESYDRFLWCHGFAGSGKTVLTSVVYEHVKTIGNSSGSLVAVVYCDYDTSSQSALSLFGSLIKQITQHSVELQQSIASFFGKLDETHQVPSLCDYQQLLLRICSSHTPVYLLIDGLDECRLAERQSLLTALLEVCAQSSTIFVAITSRPSPEDIRERLKNVAQVSVVAPDSDIRTYLEQRMASNQRFVARLSKSLFKEVVESITTRAAGMFLMAVLQLERVWSERTASRIGKALREMPLELEAMYMSTIDRVKGQGEPDSALAMRILSWMACASRTLSVLELTHALALEWEETASSPKIFDHDNVTDAESLVDVCGGLVILESAATSIRFVHPTLEEFMYRNRDKLFPTASRQLARICMGYILLDVVEDSRMWWDRYLAIYQRRGVYISRNHVYLSQRVETGSRMSLDEVNERLATLPFLSYALTYWSEHLQHANDVSLDGMALDLMRRKPRLLLMPHIVRRMRPKSRSPWTVALCENTTALHVASQIKLPRLLRSILAESPEPRECHSHCGMNASHFAAYAGHEEGLSILSMAIDSDTTDALGRTPLHWAAAHGRDSSVATLLGLGPCLEARTNDFMDLEISWTALHLASSAGYPHIVRMLIEAGADIAARTNSDKTPISLAIEANRAETVEVLLGLGAVLPVPPFSYSFMKDDYVDTIKTLLRHGADPDQPDEYRHRLLRYAARWGQAQVARVLLEAGAKTELRDIHNETPLHHASRQSSPVVVELLCRYGADTATRTKSGSTALHLAAEIGIETITPILLRHGADITATNDDGSTPLHKACMLLAFSERNCYAIVNGLLQNGANIEAQDDSGQTCLHVAVLSAAVCRGNDAALPFFEAVVELLCTYGAKVNIQDDKSRSPLHIATSDGLGSIVALLLAREADPSLADIRGRTPLHTAAVHGYREITEMLLEHGAAPGLLEDRGLTAAGVAKEQGHYALAELLPTAIASKHGQSARPASPILGAGH
jgi:ankyrin repeat protein